jgi:hypothetical protein
VNEDQSLAGCRVWSLGQIKIRVVDISFDIEAKFPEKPPPLSQAHTVAAKQIEDI